MGRAEALISSHHGASVLAVHHTAAFDHKWLAGTVSQFQVFLLRSYRWVLFAEVDEFLFPMPGVMPGVETLLDFLRELGPNPAPAVRASGFEVVHRPDEPAIPAGRYEGGARFDLTPGEMIEHRASWYRSEPYSKTVLASAQLAWNIGFHAVRGAGHEIACAEPSPVLTLVHLHKVDFDLALRKLRRSRARRWSERDVEKRWGWQNRLQDEELRAFMQGDEQLSSIPAEVRRALR